MPFALAMVRKLADAGHEVFGADDTDLAPGSHSKYLSGHFITASPRQETEEFVDDVEGIAGEASIDLVLRAFEEAFYLATQHERLNRAARLFTPPFAGAPARQGDVSAAGDPHGPACASTRSCSSRWRERSAGTGSRSPACPSPTARCLPSSPERPSRRGRIYGTRWTSNMFVPSSCSGSPAVMPIKSPDFATPSAKASRAQSSRRARRLVQSSAITHWTPNSRLRRRTVSSRGEIASTGTCGRWAETSRAVRPLRVGTTSAASPSVYVDPTAARATELATSPSSVAARLNSH